MSRKNILISACLLGHRVRFDSEIKKYDIEALHLNNFNIIPCCPEADGGLPIPRPPSEIQEDLKVKNVIGDDVTNAFVSGAEYALELARKNNIKVAILKSKSPSCSSKLIYDGSFTNKLIAGLGVTAKLLKENGITVFDETEIEEAINFLHQDNP